MSIYKTLLLVSTGCLVFGCGSDSKAKAVDAGIDADLPGEDPFASRPECEGESVQPLAGAHQMVISSLSIGASDEGMDFNGDGNPDNKMAALGSIAQGNIDNSLAAYALILPLEFFDLPSLTGDACVKFGVYQGNYRLDTDGDNRFTAGEPGDCNDNDSAIRPGAIEILANSVDDDCDGLADESGPNPSLDDSDLDKDGVTIADGDCDDRNALVHPGLAETCSDGLDNDCDGIADWTIAADVAVCSPFDADLDPIVLADESLDEDGGAVISFRAASVFGEDGKFFLKAGPAPFQMRLPIAPGIEIDLVITGATIEAEIEESEQGIVLKNGRLGGVLDAYNSDKIRGLDIEIIALTPEDSLADAIYANVLGSLFQLGRPNDNCLEPDIDVDGDGLEAFCDSNPLDEDYTVDGCIDGDGTMISDQGNVQCTEALDDEGNRRFVDGVSILLKFETVPAVIQAPLAQ